MATIQVRHYADGGKAYRARVRRYGLAVSHQFTTAAEAQAFADVVEADFDGAQLQAYTLRVLIDRISAAGTAELHQGSVALLARQARSSARGGSNALDFACASG